MSDLYVKEQTHKQVSNEVHTKHVKGILDRRFTCSISPNVREIKPSTYVKVLGKYKKGTLETPGK